MDPYICSSRISLQRRHVSLLCVSAVSSKRSEESLKALVLVVINLIARASKCMHWCIFYDITCIISWHYVNVLKHSGVVCSQQLTVLKGHFYVITVHFKHHPYDYHPLLLQSTLYHKTPKIV